MQQHGQVQVDVAQMVGNLTLRIAALEQVIAQLQAQVRELGGEPVVPQPPPPTEVT
jgi:hypothetical protein